MSTIIQIRISDALYLRDPEETALGRKIIGQGILLIDQLGFHDFTFKKLASEIKSTEASIYRYFKSKRQLLHYLIAWYWAWLEYRMQGTVSTLSNKQERVLSVIKILTESIIFDPRIPHIDERVLYRIIIKESDRSIFAEQAREGDQKIPLATFSALISFIARLLKEYAPNFQYPFALAHSLLITAQRQRYYSEYFPGVTELKEKKNEALELAKFLKLMVFSMLDARGK
jgi:AcrR family transcriptional regulator